MVVCKLTGCPYFYSGFCSNRLTAIDENGMCGQIWRKGARRVDAFNPIDDIYKSKPIIMEAEWQEYEERDRVEECESAEGCGVDSADGVSTGDNSSDNESTTLAGESASVCDGHDCGDRTEECGPGSEGDGLYGVEEEYHQITIDEWCANASSEAP